MVSPWERLLEVRGPATPELVPEAREALLRDGVDVAVEGYVAAAREAERRGDYGEAIDISHEALDLLAAAPPNNERRVLRLRLLLELARVKWEATVPGEPSSLADALELLGECDARMLPGDPIELRAECCSLSSAVYYEIGDRASCDRALLALGRAGQALIDAGRELEAARLLKHQAAICARAGDIERAHALLEESRSTFSSGAADESTARLELAEREHLLARMVLQAMRRSPPTEPALEEAIEHARRAEVALATLGKRRQLARVWNTLGRLENAAGRTAEAMEHLTAAAEAQQDIADVLGLARTSVALAEVARDAGDYERAMAHLADSLQLNLQKGSPLGLAFNRSALCALVRRLDREQRDRLELSFTQIAARLEDAERILGRVELPRDSCGPPSMR